MSLDQVFMQRCLQLAKNGLGHVAPNPMVGAVVVHQQQIIGEGYHQQYGKAHAEPTAIASVSDKSLLKQSCLYVNLEPCSHTGKTPPCAQLIINSGIPKVVLANTDPNPKVAGRGIQLLREAGIEVVQGVLEQEGEWLNKRFFTFHRLRRPYITLKWAQSADGYLDKLRSFGDGQQAQLLSSEATRRWVHKQRTEEAGILVGTNTALLDNPSLTIRHWYGRQPLRIYLDTNEIIPTTHHLNNGQHPTLAYTNTSLLSLLQELYQQNILSVLVEGGAKLHQSFIDLGLWDEAQIETTPHLLHKGVKAPCLMQAPTQVSKMGQSLLCTFNNRKLPKKP